MIQKDGFRSLGDDEEIEFTAEESTKGLEATCVRSVGGGDVKGSHRRPQGQGKGHGGPKSSGKKRLKKVRCYNCGDFGSHLASDCPEAPMPKRCHNCKSSDHLIEDCPTLPESEKRPTKPAKEVEKGNNGEEESEGWQDQSKKNKNQKAKK